MNSSGHIELFVLKQNVLYYNQIQDCKSRKNFAVVPAEWGTVSWKMLEYCIPFWWASWYKKDIDSLESVQQRATTMAAGVGGLALWQETEGPGLVIFLKVLIKEITMWTARKNFVQKWQPSPWLYKEVSRSQMVIPFCAGLVLLLSQLLLDGWKINSANRILKRIWSLEKVLLVRHLNYSLLSLSRSR